MLQNSRQQKILGKVGFQMKRLRILLLYSRGGNRVQWLRPWSPMCSLQTRVPLGQVLYISVPQLPPQENGNNNHTHFIGLI